MNLIDSQCGTKGRELEDVMGRGLCEWIGWDYKF